MSLGMATAHLRPGTHSLTIKVSYVETARMRHHVGAVTLTKTIRTKFRIC
jgi:hypothetical protein